MDDGRWTSLYEARTVTERPVCHGQSPAGSSGQTRCVYRILYGKEELLLAMAISWSCQRQIENLDVTRVRPWKQENHKQPSTHAELPCK